MLVKMRRRAADNRPEVRDRGTVEYEEPSPSVSAAEEASGLSERGRRSISLAGVGTMNVLSVVALLVVWEVVAVIIGNGETLPAPTSVAESLGRLSSSGGLWSAAGASAIVFIIGFAVALGLGLPLGFLVGIWPVISRAVHSWLVIFWATPIIALLPLFVTWFGLTTVTQVIVVLLSAIFPIVINTQVGFETTDPVLLDAARTLGANHARLLVRVRIPAAVPMIAAGVQVAAGRAVLGVIVAELFISSAGLGGKMTYYANYFQMSNYFAALVVFVLFSVVVTELASGVERRFSRFRTSGR